MDFEREERKKINSLSLERLRELENDPSELTKIQKSALDIALMLDRGEWCTFPGIIFEVSQEIAKDYKSPEFSGEDYKDGKSGSEASDSPEACTPPKVDASIRENEIDEDIVAELEGERELTGDENTFALRNGKPHKLAVSSSMHR